MFRQLVANKEDTSLRIEMGDFLGGAKFIADLKFKDIDLSWDYSNKIITCSSGKLTTSAMDRIQEFDLICTTLYHFPDNDIINVGGIIGAGYEITYLQ